MNIETPSRCKPGDFNTEGDISVKHDSIVKVIIAPTQTAAEHITDNMCAVKNVSFSRARKAHNWLKRVGVLNMIVGAGVNNHCRGV